MENVKPKLSLKSTELILMSHYLYCTCRCYIQLVFVRNVSNCGIEHASNSSPWACEGIEDGGDEEGEDTGEDEADVERGVVGGRDISSHLSDHWNMFSEEGTQV